MIVLPIAPYYDNLQQHYEANRKKIKVSFWEWIQRDYKGYQVYIVSNPTAVGEKDGCGLMFGEEQEASMFALLW
jgi:rhamnogalacturonyl hydrolase YesR